MLYTQTVSNTTLELLKELMLDKILNDFVLVGGTALSLQIGHRISIDLDLFSTKPFDAEQIGEHLKTTYAYQLDFIAKNTLKGEISGVKVDCITHNYKWIKEIKQKDNIRMADLIEIAAMKLNAITTNGTRIKDFIDIAYLSNNLTLNQMLQAYELKYENNMIMALKSLFYYDEVNHLEPIKMFKRVYNWECIKTRLSAMNNEPNKTFKSTDTL